MRYLNIGKSDAQSGVFIAKYFDKPIKGGENAG